jgi:hypothetical protein
MPLRQAVIHYPPPQATRRSASQKTWPRESSPRRRRPCPLSVIRVFCAPFAPWLPLPGRPGWACGVDGSRLDVSTGTVAGVISSPPLPLACHPEPIRRGWVKDLNFDMTDQQMYPAMRPTPPFVIPASPKDRTLRKTKPQKVCHPIQKPAPPARGSGSRR